MASSGDTWGSFLLWLQKNGLDHQELKLVWSAFEEKVLIQQKKILTEFEELKLFVQENPQLLEKFDCDASSQFLPDSFHIGKLCVDMKMFLWAWLVVNTRSIYLNGLRSPDIPTGLSPIALAPYLDLLNHNSQTKVTDVYNSKSGTFTFVSGQKYQPGEQVFITYGAHDNVTLMTEYGFIIPSNPFDYACIDLYVWKYLLSRQDSIVNLDDLLAERLSPLPIMKVLQQNDLLRNLAIQSDGEPDFRIMNFLRLWHLPCYNFQAAKNNDCAARALKQPTQYQAGNRKGRLTSPTTTPEESEDYWLDLWYSIWSGTSESFPKKHQAIESAAFSSLMGILTSASASAAQQLFQVQIKMSDKTLSSGESDLLLQAKRLLETEISLLDKAQVWTAENHPNPPKQLV